MKREAKLPAFSIEGKKIEEVSPPPSTNKNVGDPNKKVDLESGSKESR